MSGEPACPYCGNPARLVTGREIYPTRKDLHHMKFWLCQPCDAYVGCHRPNIGFGDGTRPLGRLANAELRRLKSQVHQAFDPIWKTGQMRRGQAYAWLAQQLGLQEAHVGEFDEETCQKALSILKPKPEGWTPR